MEVGIRRGRDFLSEPQLPGHWVTSSPRLPLLTGGSAAEIYPPVRAALGEATASSGFHPGPSVTAS